jgi:hypothetical protein
MLRLAILLLVHSAGRDLVKDSEAASVVDRLAGCRVGVAKINKIAFRETRGTKVPGF